MPAVPQVSTKWQTKKLAGIKVECLEELSWKWGNLGQKQHNTPTILNVRMVQCVADDDQRAQSWSHWTSWLQSTTAVFASPGVFQWHGVFHCLQGRFSCGTYSPGIFILQSTGTSWQHASKPHFTDVASPTKEGELLCKHEFCILHVILFHD